MAPAAASFDEHLTQGICTSRSSNSMTSADSVVLIRTAVNGSAFIITVRPEKPDPLVTNHVEMFENDLPDLPPQPRSQPMRPFLFEVKSNEMQPDFALRISFLRVNVDRLFVVRVEED